MRAMSLIYDPVAIEPMHLLALGISILSLIYTPSLKGGHFLYSECIISVCNCLLQFTFLSS